MIAKSLVDKASTAARSPLFLPLILVLAFLLRATFALTTDFNTHPDEIFQYLEPAHRLVFGQGIVTWEYYYGTRSWIIPGLVALILKFLAALGIDRPDIYQPTVRLVFCAISLSLPVSVYRIAQALLDEGAARLALVGTAFWYELILFAPTPMPDALGAYAFFAALAFLLGRPGRGAALAFGVLAGLTLALRFQLAPMVGVAMLIAALRWRWSGWPALLGFFFVVASAGALDAYTWGRWFSSIISNIEMNVFAHVSDGFSTAPGYYYLLELGMCSACFGYLGALGLALSWRKTWPLLVMGAAYVAALSIFGHKEWRFLVPLDPIYIIGSAVVFATYGRRLRPLVAPAFAALVAAIFVACTAAVIFVLVTGNKLGRPDVRQAYLMLSRLPDVKGVIDDSGSNLGGYYDLHQAAPIYREDSATNVARVRQSPQLFASHWITTADAAAPDGYVLLARSRMMTIWRRSKDPPETPIAPGYSSHGPFPFDSKTVPPKVTPRW
jgi:hypothetical protein